MDNIIEHFNIDPGIGGRIQVSKHVFVPYESFYLKFKNCQTYDDFMKAGAKNLGYKLFLDRMKEQGILN